jgi:hypothetical protein
MTTKTFETCTLPTVCFASFGREPLQSIRIDKLSDYSDNFLIEPTQPRDDAEWKDLAIEYKCLKAQEKTIKKRLDQLRDALIGMSDNRNSIGGGVQVEKCVKRGSIAYSEIPQLRGIDLDMYRGDPIEYWRLTEI